MAARNRFLAALDPADLALIAPGLTDIELTTGEVLYQPGQRVETVYFPNSALISIVTAMQDGRSVEVSTAGFESVVGTVLALSGAPSHAQVFVQVPGKARKLAAARLREAAVSSPSLLRLLMRYVQQDIAFSEQSVACNALHGATARLARWLLVTQDRVDSTKIPLTQEYLAIMIGVQRTTATASALALKSAGLIRYMRGKIEILDRAGLEAAACECYWAGAAGQAKSTSERRGASAMTSAAVSRRRAAAKEEAAVG